MKKRYSLKNKKRFATFISIIMLLTISTIFATTVYGFKEPSYKVVSIRQGDTLWGIAQDYKGKEDVREFIYKVKKINHLASSEIFQGAELKIPVE